jgi:predicted RecB family endonuclease
MFVSSLRNTVVIICMHFKHADDVEAVDLVASKNGWRIAIEVETGEV